MGIDIAPCLRPVIARGVVGPALDALYAGDR
jgi:hypothetical protein